jgi:hypothetical protein
MGVHIPSGRGSMTLIRSKRGMGQELSEESGLKKEPLPKNTKILAV